MSYFEVQFNIDDFERKARELMGAPDQVAFALSLALNKAVRVTKQFLIEETWPHSVTQRNSSFIRRALQISTATKHDLHVEIYDDLGRANLKHHADGGTNVPHGQRFAIPPQDTVVRGAHGVAKRQLPRAIVAITPRRALRVTARGIFVGKGGRLHLKYAFKSSAAQPKDVPFHEDFQAVMTRQVAASFPDAMSRAMATRRPS